MTRRELVLAAIVLALVAAIIVWGVVIIASLTDSPGESLPPCATEDSEGCYWDAETMGNGVGNDYVSIPDVPRCTDAIADAGGTCWGEPQ
jgi:hypothetical protein